MGETKNIATFHIPYLQYLNEDSQLTQPLPAWANPEKLLDLYQKMTRVRVFDHQMVNLHRTGKIGTFPSSLGQEAVFTAIGLCMQKEDVLCPSYRDQGAFMHRAYEMADVVAYWAGDERGNASQAAGEDFPICVPIASQCLHAAGVAFAIQYRQQARVVVTDVGDGGTSKGDFYEAMNLAGVWHLPMVFVINNNQWAISVPVGKQTATQTLAQKAIAAGLDAIQVDGNDIVAMMDALQQAIAKARSGGKATVIEAMTFRLCDHTTVDDATRYINAETRKSAWKKEPIARLGYYLENEGIWSREQETNLQQTCKNTIEKEINHYFTREKQSPESMFDYLFATLPDAYIDQRNMLIEDIS